MSVLSQCDLLIYQGLCFSVQLHCKHHHLAGETGLFSAKTAKIVQVMVMKWTKHPSEQGIESSKNGLFFSSSALIFVAIDLKY